MDSTWTVDDTFYVPGTAGKRAKLRFPIEELDPVTFVGQPLAISLDSHPRIDSSLEFAVDHPSEGHDLER